MTWVYGWRVSHTVTWTEGQPRSARWQSEHAAPPPERISVVDDRLRADVALRRLAKGEHLLYRGDWRNARQLLAALGRRLEPPRARAGAPLVQAFRAERDARYREATTLGRLLVALTPEYAAELSHAPNVRAACEEAWGPSGGAATLVSLRELLGVLGAAEWRRKGLQVAALGAALHPHYGVFSPTRSEYVDLVAAAPAPEGKQVLELGTGTGVLALLMAKRGARSVVATDLEPRAVACARENAQRLGLADRVTVVEADLFPPGAMADLILFNPPWIPERPRSPIDRAIYDERGATLERFFAEAGAHLNPGGEVWLVISDLPERLGLRPATYLEEQFAKANLTLVAHTHTAPRHGKARDEGDPLHAARAAERTSLYRLKR